MSTITSEIRLRIRAEGEKVLVDLGAKLNDIANKATLSSNNFKGLAAELKQLQQTTVQSTRNIKDYSASWRELASSVDISSKEFKQATAEANALDARLKTFQGVQTTVAANFHNIASAAKQASAAMQTATGLIRDPLTGGYRGTAGRTQYDAPIGPVAPPDTAGRYAQQQREADAQSRRDARRRETMQQRAAYSGDILGTRDPRTGAIIAGGMGPFQNVGTNFPRPFGPVEPPAAARRRNFAGAAQTAGAIAASGVFGGPEGLVGASIGALGGPGGAAAGGAIGAQVGMLRQAIGATATYASEITKLNIALKGITKTSQEYSDAQNAINSISKSLNVPIAEATSGFTKLSASVIGAGGNVNDAEIVFKGITTAIKGTGGGAAEVQGALLALSQVFSKGKVSAEELSGQLGERLPGAVTAFAKATGRSLPQLQKDLETGVVGLNDVMKFAIALETQYSETAEKVASSSEESGARMTVALDEVKLAIGLAFQPIGSIFQDSITEMVISTKDSLKILKEAISAVSKVLEDLIGAQTVKNIKDFANANLDIVKELKEGFKGLPVVIAASIDPLARTFALLLKIAEVAKLLKGEPQALGDGRYAAPEQQQKTPKAQKPPSNLPGPGGKDDANIKKLIKDKLDADTQERVNKINKEAQKALLNNLAVIAFTENKISDLQSLQTESNKQQSTEKMRQLQLDILQAESANNRIESQRVLKVGLEQLAKEDNIRLRNAQRVKLLDDYDIEIKKDALKLSMNQNKVLAGRAAEISKETDEKQKFLKELDKEIKLYGQSGDQAKEEMELRMRMRRASPRELESALEDAATRRQNKQFRDQAEQDFKDRGFTGDDLSSKLQQIDQTGIKLLQTTQATRQLKQQIEDLNATDFTQGIRNGVTSYLESIGTLSENIKGVTGSALQGLGDQLANFVTTGKLSFADLANSIIKDMIRITTQQAIVKPLLGVLGSLFPGGGAANGTLPQTDIYKYANFAGGGIMTAMGPMPLKKYARGGVASGPQMALYGEGSQNEAYVPLPDGRRIPVAMQGGSGGSTSVVVNVDATGSKVEGDSPKGEQLGRALSQAVQQELLKQKRPGGLLS